MSDAQHVDNSAKVRQDSVRAFKKSVILDAAQRVLDRDGIEGTTVRAIAKEAGYTPGALYAYYTNKDNILADLLCKSLGRAARAIRNLIENWEGSPPSAVDLATTFTSYYRQEPVELDLFLTVLQSRRIVNLSSETSRSLNCRLIAVLSPIADSLETNNRWDSRSASAATLQAAGMGLGILLLENSNRLSALGMDGTTLLASGNGTLLT